MIDDLYNKVDPLLSGTKLAGKIKNQLKSTIYSLQTAYSVRSPSISMILVGDNYSSNIYVEYKKKACEELGISSSVIRLDQNETQDDLIKVIKKLNEDDSVDAILLQLPLPKHLDPLLVLNTIDPSKDVDGLTAINQGLLLEKNPNAIVPCTPQGIVELIKQKVENLEGKLVAVIGRSLLVGKSVRILLENYNCTTIGIHSKTINPEPLCHQADIVVVAVGKKKFLTSKWVKKDAIVIDVGINKGDLSGVVGDVDISSVIEKTSSISPVPGGVGPMTITMLMKNCVSLWKKHFHIDE